LTADSRGSHTGDGSGWGVGKIRSLDRTRRERWLVTAESARQETIRQMTTPILATKLYMPPPRPNLVLRPRLIERLNQGLRSKLTLVSAPAGFGKTTLVGEWLVGCELPAAWLSLDEGDIDSTRFLTYLVAALRTMGPTLGQGVLGMLHAPQPPPIESLLTTLLNEVSSSPDHFVLVLDDYHVINAEPIDRALTFLLDHLPPQMHLVVATREDPQLPMARLRARGQLTELRAADLRFTPSEAAEFLIQAMGLHLSAEDIAALEARTEGWIAGLQLAAISLQGHPDTTSFITSFTGSHHFVMDYLVEEVLQRQPEHVQTFLLRTSILDRLCGSLCDAVLLEPSSSGQGTLEYLDRANLFLVPLDDERSWYRYHHLFADLLRQRLHHSMASSQGDADGQVNELHLHASIWYEDHGLELEAFQHAAAAKDFERAARLIEGRGMPLQFRGAVAPVLHWLESLPTTVLDAWPSLWVMYASALSMTGHVDGVEQRLQAAEAALQGAEPDEKTRNLIGHIAAIRALLAATQNQVETIIAQSRRALEYLHPDNLAVRTATIWKLGIAYQLQGDRAAACQAYTEAITISQASGNVIINMSASVLMGNVQETENQLHSAAKTYRRVLQLAGDSSQPAACEAQLGLARICYEWNDLDAAQEHRQLSAHLARQLENADRSVVCEVLLARLKLAQGDSAGAAAILIEAGQSARQRNLVSRMPEIAAAQVLTLLHQGQVAAAAHLAQQHELPLSQARVHLAQGDVSAALAVLEPWRRQVEAKAGQDERLKALALQALALQAHGDMDTAVQVLLDALALAEPGGNIRTFVDEGLPMAQLLSATAARGMMPDYIAKLLAAFKVEGRKREATSDLPPTSPAQPLIEPLSPRELEVLHLIAQGCSNQDISERLFLALDTVKGHNRKIFGKLRVQRRTEAVARARELGLL
jgi:LuxR family transcriptional regulator, maltose regulon positive regulatory protein